jgi:hypothetical protein
MVISPYAKAGAVIHTRYDFVSVIRSMEMIIGMKPLGLWDGMATPMYDAFQGQPSNAAPFTAPAPTYDRTEKNPAPAAHARAVRGVDFSHPDELSQQQLDAMLWRSVHGPRSTPPPPGPNASGADEEKPR